MAELRFALLVIILLVLNVITSMKHSNYYKETVKTILRENQEGFLGVGMTQSTFKARSIVLLVANKDGVIEECQVMCGLTIFAKFKRWSELDGYAIEGISEECLEVKHGEALRQSIEFIKNEKNNFNTLEEIK